MTAMPRLMQKLIKILMFYVHSRPCSFGQIFQALPLFLVWSLDMLTEIFESQSFIANITDKKVYFSMNIQICLIKIHKVKSSKYELPLDLLTEFFITKTTGEKVLFFNEYSNVFCCFLSVSITQVSITQQILS